MRDGAGMSLRPSAVCRIGAALAALALLHGLAQTAPATAGQGPPAAAARPDSGLVELGRRLFFEEAASAAGRLGCAACHDPQHGFSDPARFSLDDERFTPRHSQGLIGLPTRGPFHWDGSLPTLEDVVRARLRDVAGRASRAAYGGAGPGEDAVPLPITLTGQDPPTRAAALSDHGHLLAPGRRALVRAVLRGGPAALQAAGRYSEALEAVFGSPKADEEVLARALSAYVLSLCGTPSPYDRRAPDRPLSPEAARGLALFAGRARCSSCHLLGAAGGPARLTDGLFHNTGVSWRAATEALRRPRTPLPGAGAPLPLGLVLEGRLRFPLDLRGLGDPGHVAPGGRGGRLRTFKTPSLRDVARRGPFMHDGSLAALRDVVQHYAGGCGDDPKKDARLEGFALEGTDADDLVAFLESLSGTERAGLAPTAWRARAPRTVLCFVDADGQPLAGMPVGLAPAGDSVPGGSPQGPGSLLTDARGRIEFVPGGCTHTRLLLPRGVRAEGGNLVPDTCRSATVVVPVLGTCRVTLVLHGPQPACRQLLAYAGQWLPEVVTGQGGAPLLRVEPDPVVLDLRDDSNARFGMHEACYETWVLRDRASVVLRHPGQRSPVAVRLLPNGAVRVDARW